MSAFSPSSSRSSSNPFRRNKQAQILGIDNPNFGTSSDDVSSIRSGFSNHSLGSITSPLARPKPMLTFAGVERKGSKNSRSYNSQLHEGDSASIAYSKRSSNSGDDASSFTTSMYNTHSPTEDYDNPFEQELMEEEEDSLDELEPQPGLRRRRTVPSKAGSVIDTDHDNSWRTSTRLSNHPSMRRPNGHDGVDKNLIPLKAQKTLGISKRGKLMTEEEYRRNHALSPNLDNVAPKAQKMLGIPSNPFQKQQQDESRQTFGDELEQHGAKGPTSLSRRPMDVDDFKRMLLSGDREYMTPGHFHPFFSRDSSSNTDASSLSRSSLLSAADSHVDTPRSSHDLTTRPGLPRIATDPYDPNSNFNSLSPSELADNSPASLNKPLPPPPPSRTFELAGSSPGPRIPDPSTRRRLQQTKHADPRRNQTDQIHEMPATMEFAPVELPAEPVQSIQSVMLNDKPGSESMPIELPAREATPMDAPQRQAFRPSPLHIASLARSPPAVPPPRRGGSNRNTVVLPQGIPELAEKSPDPTKQSFDQYESQHLRSSPTAQTHGDSNEQSKPPVPPPRASERRTDRFSVTSQLAAKTKQQATPSQPETTGAYLRDPSPHSSDASTNSAPAPHRGSQGASEKELVTAETTSGAERPRGAREASTGQLPRLQTEVSHATSVAAADNLVSALSMRSHQHSTMSPGDTISIISTDGTWPPSGGINLASIATAVATNSSITIPGNDSNLGPGRRPSRHETLQVLEKVVKDESKTDKEKIDVLADLGALQREVDALRRSYEYSNTAIPEEDEGESIASNNLSRTSMVDSRSEDVPEPLQKKRQEQSQDERDEQHRESIIQALGAGIEGKTFLTESRRGSEHIDAKDEARNE